MANMVYQVPTLRLFLCLSPIKGDNLCLPFSQMVSVDERTPRNTSEIPPTPRNTPQPPIFPHPQPPKSNQWREVYHMLPRIAVRYTAPR